MSELIAFLAVIWREILTHLWQSTLVVVPVLVAARRLRHAPAGLVHTLHAIGLVKLLLPLALVGALSSTIAARIIPAPSGMLAPEAFAAFRAFELALDPIVVGPDAIAPPALVGLSILLGTALALCLGIGRLTRTIRRAGLERSRARSARALERGGPVDGSTPDADRRLVAACGRADIEVRWIRVTDDALGPRVSGFRRPVILIPRSLAVRLDERELDAVLLHEDAHRRRRDPLRSLIVELTTSVFGFYPLVGPMVRGWRRAVELVCDEEALRRGASSRALAGAVARATLSALPGRPISAAALGGPSTLRERLRRINDPRRYRSMQRHRLAVATITVAAATATFLPVSFLAGCAPEADRTQAPEAMSEEPAVAADKAEFAAFDVAPRVTHQVPPKYPEEARAEGLEGKIFVRATVDETGKVVGAIVDRAADDEGAVFNGAALEAVKQWTFEPARKDGEPVRCQIVIPFTFKNS